MLNLALSFHRLLVKLVEGSVLRKNLVIGVTHLVRVVV